MSTRLTRPPIASPQTLSLGKTDLSMMAIFNPLFFKARAQEVPAGPEPMMIRSKKLVEELIGLLLISFAKL